MSILLSKLVPRLNVCLRDFIQPIGDVFYDWLQSALQSFQVESTLRCVGLAPLLRIESGEGVVAFVSRAAACFITVGELQPINVNDGDAMLPRRLRGLLTCSSVPTCCSCVRRLLLPLLHWVFLQSHNRLLGLEDFLLDLAEEDLRHPT